MWRFKASSFPKQLDVNSFRKGNLKKHHKEGFHIHGTLILRLKSMYPRQEGHLDKLRIVLVLFN